MAGYGYRAQLPSSVVQRLARREPGAGSAIVEGIGEVAQTVGRGAEAIGDAQRDLAERERRQRITADVAVGSGEWAQAQLDLDKDIEALRNDPTLPPGATGFEERATELRRKRAAEFMDRRSQEREVREHFEKIIPRDTAQGILRDRDYEQRARSKYSGTQWDSWSDATSARVRSGAVSLEQAMSDGAATLAAMQNDTTTKAAMADNLAPVLVQARADGLIERGELDAAAELVAKPGLGAAFGGSKGVGVYTARIAAERKEAAQAVEREAEAARDAQKKANVDILLRAENGDASAAEVAEAQRRSAALGLDADEVTKLGYATEAAAQGKRFRTMTPAQLESEVNALRARQDAGKLTDPADVRRLERLDKALDKRDADDGASLTERFAVDPAGTLAAIRTQDPPRAVRLAEKMGKGLGASILLPAETRQVVLQGRSILSTRRAEFLPPAPGNKSAEEGERQLRKKFDAEIGAVKFQLPGEVYGDKLDTALAIMAASNNKAGKAGYDARQFARAMLVAFGATERRDGRIQGGFATFGSGTVMLPDNFTAREFDDAVARADYSGATYDGKLAASKADIRANFLPVWDPALGGYRFTDTSGRSLVKADRSPFTWWPKGGR